MSLINLSVSDFLNAVDDKTPTPGGGSVSALAIAQGISLIKMTVTLSTVKKKFINSSEEVKQNYLNNYKRLEVAKEKALLGIDADTLAFNQVMEAYKLPKDNEESIKKRDDAIAIASINASKIPFGIVEVAYECFLIAKEMFPLTSTATTSDFGVGILMIYAGLKGGILNIKTNMTGYKSEDAAELINKASEIEEKTETLFKSIYCEVLQKLK